MRKVVIPASLVDEILAEEAAESQLVSGTDGAAIIRSMLAHTDGVYKLLLPYLEGREAPKVLELGSGTAIHLCDLLHRGVDAYGIEPGDPPFDGRFHRALRLLEANDVRDASSRLLAARAERLPFEDDSFDVVVSTAVLEHVTNVEASFAEAVRVTKPNGVILIQVPNYDSFFEGHYRMMWLPYVLRSKQVARWYVGEVRGRPTGFLEHLNFTTPTWLEALARSNPAVASMETYFTSFSKLAYVPALHRALSLGLHEKLGPFAPLAAGRIGQGLKAGAAVATRGLAALGLAPEFTLVCRKHGA